jgi:hypothetical protein
MEAELEDTLNQVVCGAGKLIFTILLWCIKYQTSILLRLITIAVLIMLAFVYIRV